MPFITLGAASELQIKVPTLGTTSWGDTMRTDTFQKIAEHDHTGSGKGKQLGAGSLAADSVTGAKIRLDNDESLKARNNADSSNIDILKINTSDKLVIEAEIGSALQLSNNTSIQARNAADSSYLSLLKLNASDQLELERQVAGLSIANDVYITGRNNADSADVNLLKIDTNDDLELNPTISKLNIKNNTYVTARNNADSADVNILRLNTSDLIEASVGQLSGQGSVTLSDNTSPAADAGVITLSTDEACEIKYRIVRGTNVQKGTLEFDQDNAGIIEEFSGDNCGITFTNDSGTLDYTSTSTGDDATMTYVVIKK